MCIVIPSNIFVALFIWLHPFPIHTQGNIVNYGNQALVEANAEYRGYDLSYYPERCGISVMSPSDLGKIVWIKINGSWYGECLAIDAGAWQDYYDLIYLKEEIAEIPDWLLKRMTNNCCIVYNAEIYISRCPPRRNSYPVRYKPDFIESTHQNKPYVEWNKQQFLIECYP